MTESFDYATFLPLHSCSCGGAFELRSFPVAAGFVVAVCCKDCRTKGLPSRYSTETDPLPTFDTAEEHRKTLLGEITWV